MKWLSAKFYCLSKAKYSYGWSYCGTVPIVVVIYL